jgi:hypothetical protein
MVYFMLCCAAVTGFFGIYHSFSIRKPTKEDLSKQPIEYFDGWHIGLKCGLAIGLCTAYFISMAVLAYLHWFK